MSRVAPASHEPVDATPRGSMHEARRARILKRQGGICAYPGCDAKAEEIDHIVQLWLGGKDKDWNCEGLCVAHHKVKTAADAERRAKTKRQKFKHETALEDYPPTQKIPSRKSRNRWSQL